MYEAWQHMTILNAEVVIGTEHIGGNHSCIASPVLLEIRPEILTQFTEIPSCDTVNLLNMCE